MNFGVIFCAVGVFLWMLQVVYKITECAASKGGLPNWKDYKGCVVGEATKRDIRAIKIGASFFFLFGVFGWAVSSGDQKVYLNGWQLFYAAIRLLLPFILYLNVSMRLLIYRLSGGAPSLTYPLSTELLASLRITGFFPNGEDVPSSIVRWTNILFVLVSVSFIFIIFRGV